MATATARARDQLAPRRSRVRPASQAVLTPAAPTRRSSCPAAVAPGERVGRSRGSCPKHASGVYRSQWPFPARSRAARSCTGAGRFTDRATTPTVGPGVDPNTGLIYMQARWMDPASAQFLSVDPAVAQTGQTYSYAGDNPTDNTDPTGLCGNPSSWGSFWANCGSDVVHVAVSAVHASPAGQVLQGVSSLTGLTIGLCVGGSAVGFGVSASAQACYVTTPGGQSGATLTVGGGQGLGAGANAFFGGYASNGQSLCDQGGTFYSAGGSGGEGVVSGGGFVATSPNLHTWDLGGGWTPGVSFGPPYSEHVQKPRLGCFHEMALASAGLPSGSAKCVRGGRRQRRLALS